MRRDLVTKFIINIDTLFRAAHAYKRWCLEHKFHKKPSAQVSNQFLMWPDSVILGVTDNQECKRTTLDSNEVAKIYHYLQDFF